MKRILDSPWFRYPITLALSLALLAVQGAAAVPEITATGIYAPVAQKAAALIEKEMKKYKVEGLSIALVDDQRIVWAKGFGYADREAGRPASAETVYMAGSISKLFTATAAMQLAERGQLDIDQPLQKYLPEFSIRTRFPEAGPITPRQIMTHHSGLPSDLFITFDRRLTGQPMSLAEELALLKDEYAANPPGFVWSYSNLAMDILGYAVQRLSGRDFPSYIDQEILQPLGMDHASFVSTAAIAPFMSRGYLKGRTAREWNLDGAPCGGLRASVLDLSRFMQMVFGQGSAAGRQILQPATLAEMLRPQNEDVSLDFSLRMGLNWFLGELDGYRVAEHGGDTMLFHSLLATVPEQRLGVIVLANTASAPVVVNEAARFTLHAALEAKTGRTSGPAGRPAPGPRPEAIQPEGFYATGAGLLKVTTCGGKLNMELMGAKFRLDPLGDGRYALRLLAMGVLPLRLKALAGQEIDFVKVSGREVAAIGVNGSLSLFGEKIKPAPIPEAWLRRVGAYAITNTDPTGAMLSKPAIIKQGDMLAVTAEAMGARMNMVIKPLSDTEAVIAGLGRNMGETIRAADGPDGEILKYSGYEMKKL